MGTTSLETIGYFDRFDILKFASAVLIYCVSIAIIVASVDKHAIQIKICRLVYL